MDRSLHFGMTSVLDLIWGAANACLLAYSTTRRQASVRRLLETAPLVRLVAFSYSLYLLHHPLLVLFHRLVSSRLPSPAIALMLLGTAGVVACIAASYLFYLMVEKPFMRGSRKRGHVQAQTIEVAEFEPAV